jgi:hypothetical protein
MSNELLNRFEELHRRVNKTSRCRFIAARRLERQYKLSQWSITFLSVALIVIPLLQAMNVPMRFNSQLLNAIQVAIAVLVLAFSLLISMENYSVRAEKMHSCGLDLRDLALTLQSYLNKEGSDEEYKLLCEKYHAILRSYENHAAVDYDHYRLQERSMYFPKPWDYYKAYIGIKWNYVLGFLPHILLFFFIIGLIWFMTDKKPIPQPTSVPQVTKSN